MSRRTFPSAAVGDLRSADAVGCLVMAAGAKPPLEADDGDPVVPANPVEQVDELAPAAEQ